MGRPLALSLTALAAAGGASAASCYDGGGGFAKSAWPFCYQISASLLFYYGPNSDKSAVRLGLHAEGTTGAWTSIALSGNGGMKGASQTVVRKVNGVFVAEDRYSLDYAMPQLDPQQDVTLLFATEDGGNTSWGVQLPRDSCDENDFPIDDADRYLLWAVGSTSEFGYHGGTRGQFHANLISGPPRPQDFRALPTMDLRMPNVSVAPQPGAAKADNPYICGMFDLSKVDPSRNWAQKNQVVKFSPMLSPASAKYVHHMILYGCDAAAAQHFGFTLTHLGVVPNCESMPPGCFQMKYPWAVGSADVILPDGVGMPFGEGQVWVALQLHYFNPNLDTGVVDTSGVRMTFATQLQANDAGVFNINGGTDPGMRPQPLPPLASNTKVEFFVPSQCTSRWQSSLTVLGTLYHQHRAGKYSRIEVIRNGAMIGLLRNERRYDFNHQALVPGPVQVLMPGDQFNYTCVYDTSDRTSPTQFGGSTMEEMCFAPVLYYPLQRVNDFSYVPPGHRDFPAAMKDYSGCTKAGDVLTSISMCAQVASADPLGFMNYSNASGMSLTYICNNGIPVSGISPQDINNTYFPSWCPPCASTASCTDAQIQLRAQNVVCPMVCAEAGVSVWPDTTAKTVKLPTMAAVCGDSVFLNYYSAPAYTRAACKRWDDTGDTNASGASGSALSWLCGLLLLAALAAGA